MALKSEPIETFIRNLGFDDIGFGSPDIAPVQKTDQSVTLPDCGDMDWLADTYELRQNPKSIFPNAQTAIVVASHLGQAPNDDRYRGKRSTQYRPLPKGYGQIAQYAQAQKDYHIWMKKRLKQACRYLAKTYGAEARPYVDTAPINERKLAVNAGLGWIGKHSLLVSPKFGSKLMLGVILTNLDIAKSEQIPDMCGHCTRCQSACPTQALGQAYQLDIPRCISYLTIEHKNEIPVYLHELMGNKIFGCDDCVSACPFNKDAPACRNPLNMPRIELNQLKFKDFEDLTEEEFRNIFAGTPLKRTGYLRMLRNIKIAKKNQ